MFRDFPGGPVIKNLPANAGDTGDESSIPGLGRSPGGGHGHPLQYSCLEDPTDRGAWWATVHRVTKSRTQLKQLSIEQDSTAHPFMDKSYYMSSLRDIKFYQFCAFYLFGPCFSLWWELSLGSWVWEEEPQLFLPLRLTTQMLYDGHIQFCSPCWKL